MSVIAGVFHLDGRPVAEEQLGRIAASLEIFRPDRQQTWKHENAGFVSSQRWMAPQDAADAQPLISKDRRWAVVADARLDNRDELFAALNVAASEQAGVPDTALILAAYERWGEACAEHLLGDFAFVIRDSSRQRLFCARDPIGMRPFYYYMNERVFVFAGALRGVLSLPEVPRRLSETAIADFLVLNEEDKESTFYQGIFRLPPAHTMQVTPGGRRLQCYWRPDPERNIELGSNDEYAEAFRELFTKAVHARLRTGYPVGVMLSGGLESSSASCIAARKLHEEGRRLTAVSSVLPESHGGPEKDERDYIEAVRRELPNLDVCPVTAPGATPVTDLDEVFRVHRQPNRDGFHYMTHALFREAQRNDVRVLLCGIAGEFCSCSHGYGYYAELLCGGRLWTLARELAQRRRNGNRPLVPLLKRQLIAPLLPQPAWHAWRQWKDGSPLPPLTPMNPAFARRTNVKDRWRRMGFDPTYRPKRSVRESDYTGATTGGIPCLAEIMATSGAAFGLSVAAPFIDKRLVEFGLAIPSRQKVQNGWTRWLLRYAMDGILPEEVQWRKTKGKFSPDYVRRIRQASEELLASVEEFEHMDAAREYLDLSKMRRVIREASEHGPYGEVLGTVGVGIPLGRFLAWFEREGSKSSGAESRLEEKAVQVVG